MHRLPERCELHVARARADDHGRAGALGRTDPGLGPRVRPDHRAPRDPRAAGWRPAGAGARGRLLLRSDRRRHDAAGAGRGAGARDG
eukprot:8387078-Lingulodinium_polyedra.AAC.1